MTLKADEATADRQIIEEAEANGFMACRAIRDGLGYDQPGPNGSYYSSAMGVAYRWLRDAGEEVVYLIPDGITDVTKSERTGCWPDVFARVLAYKEAHVERRRHAEWESRRDAAQHDRSTTTRITDPATVSGLADESRTWPLTTWGRSRCLMPSVLAAAEARVASPGRRSNGRRWWRHYPPLTGAPPS